MIESKFRVSAISLASFTGKIISTGAIDSNSSIIMTRQCAMSIVAAQDWDSTFILDDYCINELHLWKENLADANIRHCFTEKSPNCFDYSDASPPGCGAHMTLNQEYICHNMWKDERSKSSTWRELYASEFALKSFHPLLKGSYVKWFTDNEDVARIAEVDSTRNDLHSLALRIFQICINSGERTEWSPIC